MGVVLMLRKRARTRALVKKIQEGAFGDMSPSERTQQSRKQGLPGTGEKKKPLISFFKSFFRQITETGLGTARSRDDAVEISAGRHQDRKHRSGFFGAKLVLPVLLVSVFLILKVSGIIVVSNHMTIAGIVLLGLLGILSARYLAQTENR